MNPNDLDEMTPTIADEGSAVIDDAQVIEKTLPAAPMPSSTARLEDRVEHALGAVRGYVIRQPMRAVVIAAVGGAALSALVSARMCGETARRTYRQNGST